MSILSKAPFSANGQCVHKQEDDPFLSKGQCVPKITDVVKRWSTVKWSPRPVKDPDPRGYCDCVGFVVEVHRDIGTIPVTFVLPDYDFRGSRFSTKALLGEVASHCKPVKAVDRAAGDIVVFRRFKSEDHVGLLVTPHIVAHLSPGGLRQAGFRQITPTRILRINGLSFS